jgi:hypothetical protein
VNPNLTVFGDARRFASLLPDRDFVQMPGVLQNKFKSSVACGLHLPADSPKLEHLATFRRWQPLPTGPLPLTSVNTAGFIPQATGDRCDGG